MPLVDAFSLTPRESLVLQASNHLGYVHVFGTTQLRKPYPSYRYSFDHQHTSDELFFYHTMAGDAAADYTQYAQRRRVPHVELFYNLSAFQPHKEVALTFRFDAVSQSRVLIYTNAGQIRGGR